MATPQTEAHDLQPGVPCRVPGCPGPRAAQARTEALDVDALALRLEQLDWRQLAAEGFGTHALAAAILAAGEGKP